MPNSVFVDTMVTNMDRITHRRFEASFSLRYQVCACGLWVGCDASMTGLPSLWLVPAVFVCKHIHPPINHTPPTNPNRTSRPSPK